MRRVLQPLGLTFVAAAALALGCAAPVQAQYVVQSAPVFAPAPVVTYYGAPSISYSVPVVPTYGAPRVSYYSAPVVTTYSAPVVASYSYAVPVVTTYSAPVVTTSPGVYTTYTYRNGLGVFRPRYVNQTYYTPLR